MANIIKPKRSNTAGKVPSTSDLVSGELGVNMADQKAYINNGTSVVQIGAGNLAGLGDVAISGPSNGQSLIYNGTEWVNQAGAGTGDVVGPSSATDNAIARYDTTTGKLIQNSVVTIDDSGNMAGIATITDINYVDFNTGYSTTLGAGQLGWDGNNTLGLGMIGGNVIQHIGEDQFFYCKASSAITKGQVIMFTGAVGASGVPTGAPATGISDGTYIMGIAAETIAANDFGLVQSFGTLRNVNTTGYSDGDILWYDPAVAGGLTKTKPSAPNVKVQMAAVINGGSSGGGTILIRVNAGSVLGGTDSNVQFGTLATGDLIRYNGTYWTNVATIGNSNLTNSSITINGTAVSLGGSISVGTVTSVSALTIGTTGTDLSSTVATGTTTPVITLNVPTASASNRGALSSADWSTFNAKQTAYTNLTTIGSLANGAGWLHNNGSGTFSYSTPTKSDVGLGNVTNDAQTKAAIVPNTTPTAGQILVGNAGGTAYAPVSMSGDATLASTGAATLATVNSNVGSFTYASITVNAKGLITAASNGTAPVTSVTGTAPIVSSGGTTPAISMAAATTSVNGYLTSTDWNTFNGKINLSSPITGYTVGTNTALAATDTLLASLGKIQGQINARGTGNGTVTSVGGTGTVSGLTLTGTVTSSGNLTLGGNLTIAGDMIYDTFTADGSTTSFTTSTTYTSGKIEVYCNGIKMRNGSDVTVTSGTAVVFATAPANTSLIDLVYPT